MKKINLLLLLFLLGGLPACDKTTDNSNATDIDAGDDPNFSIVAHNDNGFNAFNRKVEVFDIPIYAVPQVEDNKLLHAANLLAQYLDNDEDGTVDNPAVLTAMTNANAFVVMWKSENDLNNIELPDNATGQDLGNEETQPNFVSGGKVGRFDAALEEIFHIITHAGYSNAYPNVFGENTDTQLADAMNIARGGRFTSIPSPYPANAWYTYDDSTCDYACMATEYIYWAMSSLLGAQENRLSEIQQEWQLHTPALLQSTDSAIYELLTDPQYHFPTVLPDGTYQR